MLCCVVFCGTDPFVFFHFCVEQAGYQEVAEKSGFGKMRKSARQGIHFLEKKKRQSRNKKKLLRNEVAFFYFITT